VEGIKFLQFIGRCGKINRIEKSHRLIFAMVVNFLIVAGT